MILSRLLEEAPKPMNALMLLWMLLSLDLDLDLEAEFFNFF